MTINKSLIWKILGLASAIFGFYCESKEAKIDARDELKAELKEELLKELKGE